MDRKSPSLDLFIGRDGAAWRLYLAPASWTPELLRRRMDKRREIHLMVAPDVADLDRLMLSANAPFERRPTTDGGLEVRAMGRSAKVLLLGWLATLLR